MRALADGLHLAPQDQADNHCDDCGDAQADEDRRPDAADAGAARRRIISADGVARLRSFQILGADLEIILEAVVPVVVPEIVEEFLLHQFLSVGVKGVFRLRPIEERGILPVRHAQHQDHAVPVFAHAQRVLVVKLIRRLVGVVIVFRIVLEDQQIDPDAILRGDFLRPRLERQILVARQKADGVRDVPELRFRRGRSFCKRRAAQPQQEQRGQQDTGKSSFHSVHLLTPAGKTP